jgi:hypothetical protein
MKYRKIPVVIDAWQITEENITELAEMCSGIVEENTIQVPTLEGVMTARMNQYLIKGVEGEFYPCMIHIFEQTYEKVND